jgi:DNA (cytosine-5)-methyltransferase 1
MKVLDLFCGAGGAAMGLHRAWPDAEIIGVDNRPQKHYPFTFVLADAMTFPLEGYDFIWASPPCQQYTPLKARQNGRQYPDLLHAVRERLWAIGGEWCIENVPAAPMHFHVTLCGGMFGLRTYRHRRFETSWLILQPQHPAHGPKTSTKKRRRDFDAGMNISITGDVGSWLGPACMGIDWMDGNELSQAIPPAYSEFIAKQVPR